MEIQVIKRGKEEERGGQKEINGAKHICRIRDYKSFRYFSILVKNLIFYEFSGWNRKVHLDLQHENIF